MLVYKKQTKIMKKKNTDILKEAPGNFHLIYVTFHLQNKLVKSKKCPNSLAEKCLSHLHCTKKIHGSRQCLLSVVIVCYLLILCAMVSFTKHDLCCGVPHCSPNRSKVALISCISVHKLKCCYYLLKLSPRTEILQWFSLV